LASRKLVLDAIPLLRTDAAVLLMRDIVASGQLTANTVDTWFASLVFYKNPTRAMVSIVLVSAGNIFLIGEPLWLSGRVMRKLMKNKRFRLGFPAQPE
jgi:hypothetical protein